MLNMVKFSAEDMEIFFLFSQRKILTFPAIGDSLHEMSNPAFWEKSEKYDPYLLC